MFAAKTTLVLILAAASAAQKVDIERVIAPNSVLALRNPAHGSVIRLNASGGLADNKATPAYLPNGGLLQVKKAELKGTALHIDGHRLLVTGKTLSQSFDTEVKVKVLVEVGANATAERVANALMLAFLTTTEVETQLANYYVQTADSKSAAPGAVIGKLRDGRAVYKVGGNVKPPHPKFTPEPEDLWDYRGLMVVLRGLVNERGQIETLEIEKTSNTEFDGRCLAAVSRWRFAPAKKDGTPVPVLINVEMNAGPAGR